MNIDFILTYTLYSVVPLMVVALGGMFTERGGVTNIALEGLMLLGAFFGILYLNSIEITAVGYFHTHLLIGLFIAGISGALFSLIHAYAAINLKANQIISATAINMFAPALVVILARMYNTYLNDGVSSISKEILFTRTNYIITIFGVNTNIGLFVGIAILIISFIVIYKTKFGLRLRACGEHPQAADSVGINVYKMRYAGVVISGFLAGMGGMMLIVSTSTSFAGTVSGYGFLALAVMIFGQWHPFRIAIAALVFGLFSAIGSAYDSIGILANLGIKGEFYTMLPYIITIIVLIIYSKSSQAPKASGEPYDPGKR